MAYMSQENKKSKAPAIKAILKKYGIQGSIGVHHHSTLVLNIKSGDIDFIGNYNQVGTENENYAHNGRFQSADGSIQVNEFHYDKHFSGDAKNFLGEVIDAMMVGNHNNSDSQSDYFDIGWYISINIGQWDKPYIYNKD